MPNILTEALTGFVVTQVSAIDGRPYTIQGPMLSAGIGTLGDWMLRMMNCVTTASASLASGNSAGSVVLVPPASAGASAAFEVKYHNVPIKLMSAGQISGSPASNAVPGYATTSTTIRKVLVCLTVSALPAGSSFSSNAGATMAFVYGSAYAVSANVVNSGGASAYFNLVPLPKPNGSQIPVGWLNIPNSHPASGGIADHMMQIDYEATQGINLSLLMSSVAQP